MSDKGRKKSGGIGGIVVLAAVVLAIIVFLQPIIVDKTSMYPTLQEGDYVFLNKQAYNIGEPERGDIVVFPANDVNSGEEVLFVKRVIGLPGETISVSDGYVRVDGESLTEDYLADGYTSGYMEPVTVPDGSLFVMGDNRQDSWDSRDIGPIEIDSVKGEAFLRVWPLERITLI